MARALGFGTISAVGALAAALNPLYIGALHRNGVNVKNFFWFFAFFGVIAIVCLTFLP
jgi:nitrate/nitrite transporter NarK